MENIPVVDEVIASKKNVLFEITPVSRVIAGVLFIALPFIGGWIGYTYGKNNSINWTSINTEFTTTSPSKTSEQNTDLVATPEENRMNRTTASLVTIKKEIFAPGQNRVPGTGELREFETLSLAVNNDVYTVSHGNNEPLLLIRKFEVSPSNRFVYITAQESVGEPEISLYIHDVTTKALHVVEIASMVGDDEYVYPNELASIKWLDDDRLYIEPQIAEIGIVSTSSSTPWEVQADI